MWAWDHEWQALDGIRAFVRRHEVTWELAPHFELKDGALRQTGFDLTLHACVAPGLDPGAAGALRIREQLGEIAARVLPPGVRCDVDPFDAALHFRRETAWGAEIDLVVEVQHGGTFDVVDDAERRAARAIGNALLRLGIPEGVYRKHAA